MYFGWLKLDLEVVCFTLVLIGKFMVKKGKLLISDKSDVVHLGVGALVKA